MFRDGGIHRHDFKYRSEGAVHCHHKLLRNNGLKHHGKLNGDLTLLVRRKDINNPVDGVGGADGMQGGNNQMPRFCGGSSPR